MKVMEITAALKEKLPLCVHARVCECVVSLIIQSSTSDSLTR